MAHSKDRMWTKTDRTIPDEVHQKIRERYQPKFLPIPEHLQDRLIEGDIEDIRTKYEEGASPVQLQNAYGLAPEEAHDIIVAGVPAPPEDNPPPEPATRAKKTTSAGESYERWWARSPHPPGPHPSAEVYEAYVMWCKSAKLEPVTQAKFSQHIPEGVRKHRYWSTQIGLTGPGERRRQVRCLVVPDA